MQHTFFLSLFSIRCSVKLFWFRQDYFGECSEGVIKDNVVTVYELLEEMLDNGFPLATESNVLKEMIRPPTILRSVVNTLTGKTEVNLTLVLQVTLNGVPLSLKQMFVCTLMFLHLFCVFSRS